MDPDRPEPAFTSAQLRTIEITTRVASSLSFLGVVVVISTFCLSPRFRNPMHRLIFINAFYNIFDAASTFTSRAGPEMGVSSPFCQAQAFLNQMFPLADVLWSLVMAIDVYLIVFRRYDARSLKKLEWKYVVAVTTITFVPAFTFLFLRIDDGRRIYGDATIWCAIPPVGSGAVLRIASYYVPIWLSIFVTLGLYGRIGVEIIRRRRALMSILSNDTTSRVQLDDIVLPLSSAAAVSQPVGDASITQPSIASTATKTESDLEQQQQSSTATPSTTTPTTSSSSSQPNSNPSTPKTTSPRATKIYYHFSPTRRPSSSLSFRQYIVMPLLFALTLFSVWTPSTVNRILLLGAGEGSSSFRAGGHYNYNYNYYYPLVVVSGVSCSLRGFFNGVVFVLVGRGSRRRSSTRLSLAYGAVGGCPD